MSYYQLNYKENQNNYSISKMNKYSIFVIIVYNYIVKFVRKTERPQIKNTILDMVFFYEY